MTSHTSNPQNGWNKLTYFLNAKRRLKELGLVLQVIWECKVSLIGLGIFYIALWVADQGQDILLALNEHSYSQVAIYIALASLLAIVHWFAPRFFFDVNVENKVWKVLWKSLNWDRFRPATRSLNKDTAGIQPPSLYETIPRILGITTLLVAGFAILHALQQVNVDSSQTLDKFSAQLWLLVLLGVYAYLLSAKPVMALQRFYQRRSHIVWIASGLLASVCFIAGLWNDHSPEYLSWVVWSITLWSFLFYIFIVLRKVKPNISQTRGLQKPPIPRAMQAHLMIQNLGWCRIDKIVVWIILLAVAIFVSINIAPLTLAPLIGTVGVVVCGIINGIFIASLLFFIDRETKILATPIILVVLGCLYANVNTPFHNIRTLEASQNSVPADSRISLENYIHQWVNSRESDILATDTYPVFIVAASGGGIRAAYWTAMINAHLHQETTGDYTQHLLALSGASGGTVGSMMFAQLVTQQQDKAPLTSLVSYALHRSREGKKHDFLSPSVAAMLGRDPLGALSPTLLFQDRSTLMEKAWEEAVNHALNIKQPTAGFADDFLSLWYRNDHNFRHPLVFANATRVENGQRAIVSPVQVQADVFSGAIDILSELKPHSISHATAALLSARFPFVSPSGKTWKEETPQRYVDGGYFDNGGAMTAAEIMKVFTNCQQQAKQDSLQNILYSKLALHIIKIDNDTTQIPLATVYPDILAPVNTIVNIRGGHATRADIVLQQQAEKWGTYHRLNLYRINISENIRPVYPLGWNLSDIAAKGIRENLQQVDNQQTLQQIQQLIHP